MMGPSGFGFIHPAAIASNESVLADFVVNTVDAAEQLSMSSYVLWDVDGNGLTQRSSPAPVLAFLDVVSWSTYRPSEPQLLPKFTEILAGGGESTLAMYHTDCMRDRKGGYLNVTGWLELRRLELTLYLGCGNVPFVSCRWRTVTLSLPIKHDSIIASTIQSDPIAINSAIRCQSCCKAFPPSYAWQA